MFQKFRTLCDEAKRIREEVFVKEQGFQKEFDEIDERAIHLVFYDEMLPFGVCRYYEDTVPKEYHLGRIAICKAYRGKGMGSYLLRIAEQEISSEGGEKIVLSAQAGVKGFYEKNGYAAVGEPYYDEYCEHIRMEKRL